MANLYPARRRRNAIWIVLAYAATAFGLGWLVMILGAVFLPETRGKTFDTRRRSQRSAALRGRGCRLKGLALFERNAPNVASRLLVRSIPDLVAVEQELTTENQESDP